MGAWIYVCLILKSIESQSKHQIPKNFVLFRFIVTVVLSVANIVKYLDLLREIKPYRNQHKAMTIFAKYPSIASYV